MQTDTNHPVSSNFFAFFTRRHMLANLFTIMVFLLGLGSLIQIKRDIFPDVDFGEMIIATRYPGASPEDVELNVTNEIEREIKGISNIDEITSYSMEDLSIVMVTINMQASDKDEIKDEIRNAVNRVTDLPPEVTDAPLITEIKTDIIPVIEVGLAGDIPYRKLREIARLFVKKLENVPGVSKVEDLWYLDREVRVEVSPAAVSKYQIALRDIASAISRRNIRSTGGSFESYTSQQNLVTLAQFKDPQEVNGVIVRSTFDGPKIRVSDIAQVVDGFEEPTIITRMNGRPAITFKVFKQNTADIVRTVRAVREMVERERELLPEGVDILFADDVSYYVSNRFNVLLSNGAIGLLLVIVVLAVFLNIRSAFWVGLSIPIVLLGIVFFLPITGAFLDVITLTAMILVIGIIVDDGIIVSENIVRRRELGDSPLNAATEGIRGVFKPVITTLVTTFLAFAPMFFMSGVFGEFVRTIPLVITLAVLISVAEMIVALPAHLVSGLGGIQPRSEGRRHWFDFFRNIFRTAMRFVLKLRYVFIALSIVLMIGSVYYAVNKMRFILFPSSSANAFFIYIELPVGASLEKTADKAAEIEEIIATLPDNELLTYTMQAGTHGERQPGENAHWAMIRVDLTPYAQRSRVADDIVADLRKKTAPLEGFENITYSINAGGPPVGKPVTIRVVGSDERMRRELSDSLVNYISAIDGVTDIDRNDKLGKQQVELEIDYDELSQLGLTVQDVARSVRIAYDGEVVTSVRYGDEDVDFRVLLEEAARRDTRKLADLLIPNNTGRLIPLKAVANLRLGPGPSSYFHYDRERTTTVTADLVKDKASPLEVVASVLDHFDLGRDWPGMRFVVGGEAEETAESFRSLLIAFIIAVIAIYFVLTLLFNSFTQPIMVMIAIPFGIIAVIITFALHGQPVGFLAMMGLIGLSGVVVNDSLVLVNHINELHKEQPDAPIVPLVAQGASDRLRAVTLTTITTVVGLLPLAYGFGGSDPFIAPMALALGYGLLFATPLTLLLIPCLYVVRGDLFFVLRWMVKPFRRAGRKN
jgi:multidrug efflux pump subunit AcrB